jgi:hypothetical protein
VNCALLGLDPAGVTVATSGRARAARDWCSRSPPGPAGHAGRAAAAPHHVPRRGGRAARAAERARWSAAGRRRCTGAAFDVVTSARSPRSTGSRVVPAAGRAGADAGDEGVLAPRRGDAGPPASPRLGGGVRASNATGQTGRRVEGADHVVGSWCPRRRKGVTRCRSGPGIGCLGSVGPRSTPDRLAAAGPTRRRSEFSTGLGWPLSVKIHNERGLSTDEPARDAPVSRETSADATAAPVRPRRRTTTRPDVPRRDDAAGRGGAAPAAGAAGRAMSAPLRARADAGDGGGQPEGRGRQDHHDGEHRPPRWRSSASACW